MKQSGLIKRNIPNMVTAVRIFGTVCLLFLEPLSAVFYIVYTVAGVSDALDGFLARKMKLESSFGSKLDSVADLLFYAVMLIKLFPVLWKVLPKWIWLMVELILLIRVVSYLVTAVKYKCFAALHTRMNKLTGGAVFLLPYSLFYPKGATPYSVLVCIIALAASIQELWIHIGNQESSTS